MRSGIPYPDERLLIVRPCHVSLCMDVRPAAKLLSALLYRYSIRQESKEDADNINELRKAEGREADQDASFRIYRKQSQLVKDMVGEITEKTLHDVAVPCLQLLGYLDLEEYPGMNCYILHIDRILRGIAAYTQDLKDKTCCQLEKFLIELPQLENVLISVKSLEKFLIDKKNFQLSLEKVLMDNRKSSNCHRGRKPRTEAGSEGDFETPKIYRDIKESKKESKPTVTISEQDVLTHSSTPSSFSPEEETVYQLASQLKLSYLRRNEKNKGHCSKLVKEGIKTLEQMKSLMQFCKQRDYLKGKDLNLGNLAGEVEGWSQLQEKTIQEPAKCKKAKVTNEYLKANTVYW